MPRAADAAAATATRHRRSRLDAARIEPQPRCSEDQRTCPVAETDEQCRNQFRPHRERQLAVPGHPPREAPRIARVSIPGRTAGSAQSSGPAVNSRGDPEGRDRVDEADPVEQDVARHVGGADRDRGSAKTRGNAIGPVRRGCALVSLIVLSAFLQTCLSRHP